MDDSELLETLHEIRELLLALLISREGKVGAPRMIALAKEALLGECA